MKDNSKNIDEPIEIINFLNNYKKLDKFVCNDKLIKPNIIHISGITDPNKNKLANVIYDL